MCKVFFLEPQASRPAHVAQLSRHSGARTPSSESPGVTPRAAEMVQEWGLAIDKGLKIGDLANNLHIYPAYTMGNMQAAADIRVKQLLAGISGRLVRALAGGRRRARIKK